MVKIEYLCDCPDFAKNVARWIFDEFIDGIRNDLSYEKVLSKVKDCSRTEFPIRLVAVISGKCVGTVSIVQNDLKCRDYAPWLAALYVDEQYRDNKIGEHLIEHVKAIAKDLGYNELYLRTEHASDYYKKLGWRYIETCEDDFELKPDVFRYSLK